MNSLNRTWDEEIHSSSLASNKTRYLPKKIPAPIMKQIIQKKYTISHPMKPAKGFPSIGSQWNTCISSYNKESNATWLNVPASALIRHIG